MVIITQVCTYSIQKCTCIYDGSQELNLKNCPKLTDAGCSSLSLLPSLQTLNLSFNEGITGAGLANLGASPSKLRTLILSYCHGIRHTEGQALSFILLSRRPFCTHTYTEFRNTPPRVVTCLHCIWS